MFGGFNANAMAARMAKGREEAKSLPSVDVTHEEFMRRAIAAGWKKPEAKLHATVSRGLGSHTRVGNEMLRVVDAPAKSGK